MLSIQGYYDDSVFQSLEKAKVSPNQKVIIPIHYDYV